MKIQVRNNNVEGALKTMKHQNAKDGQLKVARERQEGYLKPGVKRRKAKEEAKRNAHKKERNYAA